MVLYKVYIFCTDWNPKWSSKSALFNIEIVLVVQPHQIKFAHFILIHFCASCNATHIYHSRCCLCMVNYNIATCSAIKIVHFIKKHPFNPCTFFTCVFTMYNRRDPWNVCHTWSLWCLKIIHILSQFEIYHSNKNS
jgi:hypothetical protein